MTIDNINVEETVKKVTDLIAQEKNLSPVLKGSISTVVTEYQAEVLEDQHGKKYVAPFPEGVTRPIQYGIGVKVNSVYMSQYQMIPYNRIEEQFLDQMQMPISAGSIVSFNRTPTLG